MEAGEGTAQLNQFKMMSVSGHICLEDLSLDLFFLKEFFPLQQILRAGFYLFPILSEPKSYSGERGKFPLLCKHSFSMQHIFIEFIIYHIYLRVYQASGGRTIT